MSACAYSGPRYPPCIPSRAPLIDRKSTRLNSSHGYISYAVFCLKKKKDIQEASPRTRPLAHQTLLCSDRRRELIQDTEAGRPAAGDEALPPHLEDLDIVQDSVTG